MKTILRKIITILVLAFGIICLAPAQPGGPGNNPNQQNDRLNQRLEMMAKELSLTPEQKNKVQAIEKENMEQMNKLRIANQGGGDREKMRADVTRLRAEADKKIMAVLTESQKPKYEELKKRVANQRQPGTQERPQGFADRSNPEGRSDRVNQRVEMMAKDLALNPDQKAKILAIEKTNMEQMDKLRSENQGGGDREKMRAELMRLRSDADNKIKAVLTAEQKPKYDEFKKKFAQQTPGDMQGRPQSGPQNRPMGGQQTRPQGRPQE